MKLFILTLEHNLAKKFFFTKIFVLHHALIMGVKMIAMINGSLTKLIPLVSYYV